MTDFGVSFNKILFQHVRTVWSVHGYYVIRLPLSLKSMTRECTNLRHAMTAATFSLELQTDEFRQEMDLVFHYITEACAAENFWPVVHSRPRRQALLLAAAAFLGSDLVLHVADYFRHDALASRVDDLQAIVHRLSFVLRRELQKGWKEALARDRVLLLTTHARSLLLHVADFTDGLLHVQHQHRLPISLLTPSQARHLWRQFLNVTNAVLPYSMEALYAVHSELRIVDQEIVVDMFFPVPDRQLQLYLYQPFPVRLNNTLYLPDLQTGLLFAIDNVHQDFRVTTAEELKTCVTLGRAQFCPFSYIQHDFAHQCLPALFLGHWSVATSACSMRPAVAPWYLIKAGRGWWYAFLSEKVMYTISCTNHSRTSAVWPTGFNHFHLEENCDLTCSRFSIPRRRQEVYQAEAVEKIFPTDLFMRSAIPDLELPDPGVVQVTAHPVTIMTTGLLTVVVTVLFVACCCVLCYWREELRRVRRPGASPPPAPPTSSPPAS